MLANRTSRWSLGAALLCIVLIAASWFLLISPRRAEAADVRGQAAQADGQASQLQLAIAQLKSEFADLPKSQAELKAIKRQLPPKANIPGTVRDLQTFAAEAGVSLDSITPGIPTILTAPGEPAPTTAAVGSVVSVPLGITVTGDYFEVSLFVKYLQTKQARSYLITGLSLDPAEVPATATAAPIATAVPSGTATPAVEPTPVPSPTAAEPSDLSYSLLTIQGSLFVLMDGTSTLESVKREAAAAAAATASTPTSAATGAASQ